MKMVPRDSSELLGKPTGYFLAGGFIAHLNYYISPLKSVIAVRYDEFNPNDLIIGDDEQTISVGYNYLVNGLRSCLKIQYWKRIKDKDANAAWAEDQLRVAWQFQF